MRRERIVGVQVPSEKERIRASRTKKRYCIGSAQNKGDFYRGKGGGEGIRFRGKIHLGDREKRKVTSSMRGRVTSQGGRGLH